MPAAPEPVADDRHRLLTIGEVARRSGLTASALRFYDREGVLVPADVETVEPGDELEIQMLLTKE